jgi:DNA-binding CsgD family transcriptional regulator
MGKSALLGYLSDRADGWHVARAVGIESEMELVYSGLHQLGATMLEQLDHLPVPQRDALAKAFGQIPGPPPDRFLVGLAALTLFAEVAERQPLVCIVDDAQWLDHTSAQILGFVARRLLAERIVLVCAARTGIGDDVLAGLPELPVAGLGDSDARALLLANVYGPLDAAVCNQIVAESHGNPLALLELPRTWSTAELAGGYGLLESQPVAGRIERSYAQRLAELPSDSQLLVLTTAAEPLGDPVLLYRAAEALGIEPGAADSAVDAGLLHVGGRVEFAHPLVRSAAYRAASAHDRHRAHHALAEATNAETDPDRRAWHRAHAALAPEEDVAEELERSASRAQERGGFAATAAFLARSSELTPEPHRRAQRALAAANAKRLAGLPDAADALIEIASQGPLDELERTVAQRLRGQLALDSGRVGDAAPLLLDAARRLEALDVPLARETYLEALLAACAAGPIRGGLVPAAEAARAAPPAPEPLGAIDVLVDGLAVVFTDGFAVGAPILRRAITMFQDVDQPDDERDLRGTRIAARIAGELLDDESWNVLGTRHVEIARENGLFGVLPLSLGSLASLRIHEGNLQAAAVLLAESDAISAKPEGAAFLTTLMLAAYQGDEAEVSRVRRTLESDVGSSGNGLLIAVCDHAASVLDNGQGHYEKALEAARKASDGDELNLLSWSLPEVVEAAARTGNASEAVAAHERLAERTRASGTDLAGGIEARARALVSDEASAEAAFEEAIELLDRTRLRLHAARARLLYGEWLRREGRRVDAREQLRTAHEMFAGFGVHGFAERARRELLATGETVRKRTDETRGELTPQEREIARLAGEGHTNSEIGAQLFLSPRTVEWHLRKVFTKLDISSRRQLRGALSADGRLVTSA